MDVDFGVTEKLSPFPVPSLTGILHSCLTFDSLSSFLYVGFGVGMDMNVGNKKRIVTLSVTPYKPTRLPCCSILSRDLVAKETRF